MGARTLIAACAIAVMCAALACRDAGAARPSRIDTPRVLALESEPAEVAPGERATYRVLAVDAEGDAVHDGLSAGYCLTPKPLADDRLVAGACLDSASRAPIALRDAEGTATLPAGACALFGPVVPAEARPRDADATGGYYQPLRVAFEDAVAIGLHRIRCPLPNAPLDVARAFEARYTANANPELLPLTASAGGRAVALDGITPGQAVTLRAGWPERSAERYVLYDPSTAALVERRESLRVSWYVTDGELARDRTGRGAADPATTTENTWQAPDAPTHVRLWLVLRDDRGGTTHAGYDLDVRDDTGR
jgi:hypothetical protein